MRVGAFVGVFVIALLAALLAAAAQGKPATTIPLADKIRLKDAQLTAERALNALLATKEYSALQAANAQVTAIATEIEAKAGCKLDPRSAECVPPPAPPEKK